MRSILVLLLCMSKFAQAQNSNHIGLFPTIDHSGAISKHMDYSLYYFGGLNLINNKVNNVNDPPSFSVFYAEQALTYHPNLHLSLTGSYVYERQHPFENVYRNENRFYLQAAYQYNLGRTSLKYHFRFDGRFIQDRVSGENPFTNRIRYQFGISTPL